MVIPGLGPVIDEGCSKTPGRVNASPGYGNRGQVHHEHCKSNGQRCQYRDVGVAHHALGIGGGEDGVDEEEGAEDLRPEGDAPGVTGAFFFAT